MCCTEQADGLRTDNMAYLLFSNSTAVVVLHIALCLCLYVSLCLCVSLCLPYSSGSVAHLQWDERSPRRLCLNQVPKTLARGRPPVRHEKVLLEWSGVNVCARACMCVRACVCGWVVMQSYSLWGHSLSHTYTHTHTHTLSLSLSLSLSLCVCVCVCVCVHVLSTRRGDLASNVRLVGK